MFVYSLFFTIVYKVFSRHFTYGRKLYVFVLNADLLDIFRIGGDEFVVILENEDYQYVEALVAECNYQLDHISKDESLEPWERVSAAIGFAKFDPSIDHGYENVFKRADKAMYARKRQMKAVRMD